MKKVFNGLHGIKAFAFDLISIIAQGNKETIDKVEDEISKGSIINYIYGKYSKYTAILFNETFPYDLEAWNKAFQDYSGWVA